MLALLVALALAQTDPAPAAPPAPPAPSAPSEAEAPERAPAPPPRASAPERPPAPPRAAPSPRPPRAPAAAPGPEDEAEEPVLKGFDRKSGKRFSGDFDEAEVSDALRQIADAADWSIILPPGEHGTISARFKNVPVEDALKAVLSQAGLAAARDETIVTVRARSASGFPGVAGLSREAAREVRRAAEQARREAERAKREVDREMRRIEREMGGSNDKVIHGDVVIRPGEAARDIVTIRGSIKVEPGAEVRDCVAVLGSIQLEPGAMARQAVAVGGDVRLGPGAEIAENAVSVGGHVDADASAEIGGETVSVSIPGVAGLAGLLGSTMVREGRESRVFQIAQILAKFAVYFVLGLLVLALFPRRLDAVAASFTTHPWKSILTGLLGVVVTPLVILILVATIIGIPLVPVAALLVVAAGVLGFAALAWYIGRNLPFRTERGTSVLQLAMGTAIVVLVTAIPLLGGMAWVAAALLGFGAVLRSRFGSHSPVLPTTIPPPAAPPPAAVG